MNLDLDDLREQAEQLQPKPNSGVASLVFGLHAREELRGLITLESVALPPVPHHASSGLQLLTLLCVTDERSAEEVRFRPAWKLLAWSWPKLDLVGESDLRGAGEHARHNEARGIDGWRAPSPAATAEPLRALLQQLENALSRPWPPEAGTLQTLATLYRQVMPPAAIGLIGLHAPDAVSWLPPEPETGASPPAGGPRS
jgi:hypothetical protein